MSIETRLRNTGFPPSVGGGGSSNSAGLAGTGLYYLVGSTESTLPSSKVLTPGANISFSTDGTTLTISSNTGGASNSAGLMGTGLFFLLHTSGNSTSPFSKLISAGSSVTTHTDGTSFYINAITNASASSAGLAGTGSFYMAWSSDPLLSNEKVFTAGSSVTVRTDSTSIYVDAITAGFTPTGRLINTTYPLSGGGDFTADRTHLVDTAFLISSNRTISTLYPMSGGGNLGANRTFFIDTAFLVNSNRLINTTFPLAGGGNLGADLTVTVNTAFFANSASFFVAWSSDPLLSNEKILTAGSSVTITTDSTAIYINAITNASASSGGLAGTGFYYLVGSNASGLPSSKVLAAGSSVTIVTDSTSIYINATTSSGGGSGTINSGSANYLAYYPSSGTTIDDAPISVSTGSGIAPFNVAILTTTAASATNGDFWFQLSSNKIYLACMSATSIYYIALAT